MVEETVTAPAPVEATPKAKVSKAAKATKPKQPKKPAAHPKYEEMVTKAVQALKEHQGSSRKAILKFILANIEVGKEEKPVNTRLNVAPKKAVAAGHLKQAKGTGATGRFRVRAKKAAEKKPVAAKKTKVEKKAKTPKKAAATPKRAVKPKKPARKKKTKATAKPKKVSKIPAKPKAVAKKPKAEKKAAKPKATKPKTPKLPRRRQPKPKSPRRSQASHKRPFSGPPIDFMELTVVRVS